jgi:hypothetical protein
MCDLPSAHVIDALCAATQFSGYRSEERTDLLPKWRQVMHSHATPAALGDQAGQMKPMNMLADRLDVGPT